MSRLYPEKLTRDFKSTDENERLLSAYDKVLREQYMLAEDATADAKKTLDAIIGATKDDGGDVHKMAMGMKKSYEKNKGFSKEQAQWIYKTSQALFKK
jgi:hypothetical protein